MLFAPDRSRRRRLSVNGHAYGRVTGRKHKARHRSTTRLRLLCVISRNCGSTADPEGDKPGRYLGYTRYDEIV